MRSVLEIDADHWQDALTGLKLFGIKVIGTEKSSAGRLSLWIEGDAVPNYPKVSFTVKRAVSLNRIQLDMRFERA